MIAAMIIVRNIKTALGQPDTVAVQAALKKIHVSSEQVQSAHLSKTSIDARKHDHIIKVNTVVIHLYDGEERIAARALADVEYKKTLPFSVKKGSEKLDTPIVIAGFGPAGLFAADLLAKNGYHPIVVERGMDVDHRVQMVEKFWTKGVLNSSCNVQFGEGGAGTFSDGKLTTRINDPLCDYVLRQFELHGAPSETLTKAKPHIGTDKLRRVVKSMREEILKNGGQVLFNSCLDGLDIQSGKLRGVTVNGQPIATKNLILAIGHSA
ncbi:MAG: hypothetical protein RR977_03540, partial [Oscillospiraceae bacterium]